MPPKNLLREPLRSFKPYVVGKPIDDVRREYGLTGRIAKMASNENPLGTSPLALEAMRRAVEDVSFYPDDNAFYLREKLARRHQVRPENILIAAGSVELIELAGWAFLNAGDGVVTSEKTFAMYSLAAAKAGARFTAVPMRDGGYRYDLPAIAAAIDERTKIVFLANPTNPTGTWFTRAEFDAFMDAVPEDVLVVYDAAYEEYITVADMPRPMEHLGRGRRIAVLRTFSKIYGLAGIRIGYGFAPEDIVQGIGTCRVPFNANLVAQAAALGALEDADFVTRSRDHNSAELAFLREGLSDLPVTVPPSQTNFVYIDTRKSSSWLFEELQRVGVIVRPVGPAAIRVSTGLRQDNERFIEHVRRLILGPGGELA